MLLAPLAKEIPAPVTRDTLLDDPFKLKLVAPAAAGPMIVMLLAPVFSVIFAPATRTMVPVLVAAAVPKAAT
jgi:hypothetical protein